MERYERDGGLEFRYYLLERSKGVLVGLVQVGLVHFVGQEYERMFLTETNEGFLGSFIEEGTCGVARVDDNESLDSNTLFLGFCDRSLD